MRSTARSPSPPTTLSSPVYHPSSRTHAQGGITAGVDKAEPGTESFPPQGHMKSLKDAMDLGWKDMSIFITEAGGPGSGCPPPARGAKRKFILTGVNTSFPPTNFPVHEPHMARILFGIIDEVRHRLRTNLGWTEESFTLTT